MWLFLPFGFFSIVAHRDHDDALLVRARAHKDLELLRARLDNRQDRVIGHTPKADYPYRMTVTRAELDVMMTQFIQDELLYYNFKSECGATNRLKWPELHRVWETMHGHEDADARPPPAPSRKARH